MIKFLNVEQENWLYLNYSHKTNEELAVSLTDMVKKENAKNITRMEALLLNVTDAHVRRDIRRNLERLKSFKSITPGYVRTFASRMHCPPKSHNLKSSLARKSANIRHIKRWKEKAIVSTMAPKDIFRSMKLNESRIITFSSEKEIRNVRTYLAVWNRDEGSVKEIFITCHQIPETTILRFVATLNRALK